MKNNLLIITHAYPPKGGGGVQRIVKFAKYLKDFGWHATVVSPKGKNIPWVDEKRLNEVKNISSIKVPISNTGADLISKIKRKLIPIDAFYHWTNDVLNTLQETETTPFQLIFTSGPPHSVHLIGAKISKQFNLKWVADFRDHFTLSPEYKPSSFIHNYINKKFERKIYQYADGIITNTLTNKGDVFENFRNINKDKIHTIYNGYDHADLATSGKKINWSKDKVNYIYLGGLRGDHIDGVFYKTLSNAIKQKPEIANELKIHILGDYSRKGDLIEKLNLSNIINLINYVPFDEVGDYLEAADAGITWQRDRIAYKGTVAGKVYDYIGKQLPIFSIGQDEGEIFNILNDHNIGISASPKELDKSGTQFLAFHKNIKANIYNYSEETQRTLDIKFNRYSQSKQLAEIFNTITGK